MTPVLPLQLRVLDKAAIAQDVVALTLAAADGGGLPGYEAGAHIELQLPGGCTRAYSLCNAMPDREPRPAPLTHYRIAVLREPASRGGSRAVHEQLQVGDLLRAAAPRNAFPLHAHEGHHLLLAAGIGITPILSMAYQLSARGADFSLLHLARTRAHAAFSDEIRQSGFAGHAQLHFSQATGARTRLDLQALLRQQPEGTALYVCGPQAFMDAALDAARRLAWPDALLHRETFGPTSAATASDLPFEVQLHSSGKLIQVPVGVTVVQALRDAGVDLMTSCEQGVCGTCLTRVLQGVPDHRDQYLTPEEQATHDQFLPCCSRSTSPRLVLDL